MQQSFSVLKIRTHLSVVFLYTIDEQPKEEIKKAAAGHGSMV